MLYLNKRNIIETYLQVMPHLILFEKIDPLEYKSLVEQKRKNEVLENELSSLRKKISRFDEINKYLKLNNVLEEIE